MTIETIAHLRLQQLHGLCTTYPTYRIHFGYDEHERLKWTARLRTPVRKGIQRAGVPVITRPDAIALATALAWQAPPIHRRPVPHA
ncbi:hypothetical protein [Nonomuraea sp. NPDC049400]|uniref:hypothetical protein n=1 Tax=Nonomuraea sp. NPDC049400 TaxID=3364352 RepID=UPI0037AC9E9F